MTNLDKLRTIRTLKYLMVNGQNYEVAAYLRDIEKSKFSDIDITKLDCLVEDITPLNYAYILELLDRYVKSGDISPEEISSIYGLVDTTFLELVRQIKLDALLRR